MPLRTLHKDSCLNLKALAEHNRIALGNTIQEDYPENDENIDSSSIIDLKLVHSKVDNELNAESPTGTSVSSNSSNEDSNDAFMQEMDNNFQDDGKPAEHSLSGKNKKVMAMIFPWYKNKESNNIEDEQKMADNEAPDAGEEKTEDNENLASPASNKDLQNTTSRNLKRTISPFDEQTNSAAPNLRNSSFSQEDSEPTQKSIMKNKKHKVKKNVSFSTTARLITIYPHKDLPPYLKRQIWWQRTDYKNFKKTIDIISRELIQHASDDVWFLGAQDHRYVSPTERSEENEFGAKWWCQYGHSRRGLEHICSMAEGRFRQQNVERAMTRTLIEQERQNLSENPDIRKLGMAAFRFTAFARDLARAVGKADSEAVRVNFEASKMKDFRHYMSSKYDKGFDEWDQSSGSDTLASDSMKDIFAERTSVIIDDPMSELDSFNENPFP